MVEDISDRDNANEFNRIFHRSRTLFTLGAVETILGDN